MRIRWIRENRSNLWKFGSRNKSTIRILKNRAHESGFANLWSRICQSRNKMNLLGVRIRDYDTKRISYTIPASLVKTLIYLILVKINFKTQIIKKQWRIPIKSTFYLCIRVLEPITRVLKYFKNVQKSGYPGNRYSILDTLVLGFQFQQKTRGFWTIIKKRNINGCRCH